MSDDKNTQRQIELLERKRDLMNSGGERSLVGKTVDAISEVPGRVGSAAPIALSTAAGVMAAPGGNMASATAGAAGRVAGRQLETEMEHSPMKGMLRFADASMPGISILAPNVPPDIQRKASESALREAPMEFALGAAMGIVGRGLKGLSSTRIMGKDYTLTKVKEVVRGLDNARTVKGKVLREAIDEAGDVLVDGLDDTLKRLPEAAKKYLKTNADMLNLIRDKKGRFVNSISNTQNIKEAIGDFMTSKDWVEAGGKSKAVIKSVYSDVRDIMVKANPTLKQPLNNYHEFMSDVYFDVNRVVRDAAGKIREKKLVTAMKPTAERTTQLAIQSLSELDSGVKGAVKGIEKFISRQNMKAKIKRFVPYAIAAAGGYGFIRKKLGGD